MINKILNKKTISIVLTLCLGASLLSVALNSLHSEKTVYAKVKDKNEKEISEKVDALNVNQDDESIYVIQNADGTEKKKILSKTSGSNNEQKEITTDIPVTQSIKYYVDGKEISPDKMSGKSGRVTMEFNYKNLSQSQNKDGKYIPFAVLTGLVLDNDIYSNVEVSSGKIFNDADKCVVVGMAIPGMNKFLGLSGSSLKDIIDIGDSFKIKANVKNFSLLTTMSLVTNDFFNEIDTENINDISDITGSLQKLGDGMNALLDGVGKLNAGIGSLGIAAQKVDAGVDNLESKVAQLAGGAGQVSTGIGSLVNTLTGTITDLVTMKTNLEVISAAIGSGPIKDQLDAIISVLGAKIAAMSTPEKQAELQALQNGANTIAGGLSQVDGVLKKSGTNSTIKDATSILNTNLNGAVKQGVNDLTNGLNKYNEEGIKNIVGLSDKQELKAIPKFKEMINNSKTYRSYIDQNKKEGVVKFIFRTDGIKSEKANKKK